MRHKPAAKMGTLSILVLLVLLLGCAGFGVVAAATTPVFNWNFELNPSRIITISIGPALRDRCFKPPYSCSRSEWWRRTLGITYSTAHQYQTRLTMSLPEWLPTR